MTKLIGLVPGLYVEEWIEPAIQQALKYCDEVVVSIGAYVPELNVLHDRTLERAEKYGDKVTIVNPVVSKSHIGSKGPTMNKMVATTSAGVGDWLWVLDTDEFYFEQTVQKIRKIINAPNKLSSVWLPAKFFFLNMTRYLHSKHPRLFKITHQDDKFKPSGALNWLGAGEVLHVGRDAEDDQFGMFHYSLLTSPRYRRLFWETEFGHSTGRARESQDRKIKWLDQIYMNFELDRENYWIDKNVELLGLSKRTPLWAPAFSGQPDGTLYQYSGPQPPVIEQAGLHLVKDFRVFRESGV